MEEFKLAEKETLLKERREKIGKIMADLDAQEIVQSNRKNFLVRQAPLLEKFFENGGADCEKLNQELEAQVTANSMKIQIIETILHS